MPTQLPRLNVTVTEEQHALLLELASLDPETRSASGYIRQLLDEVTPLLRVTVPMMRAAAQETDKARSGLRGSVREFLTELEQQDLLDLAPAATAERTAAKRGPHRTARRGRRQP